MSGAETVLDAFVENSPYSICVLDKTGLLIHINEAGRDMLHILDEDVVGKYNVLEGNIVETQGKMPLVRFVFENGKSVKFSLKYDIAN